MWAAFYCPKASEWRIKVYEVKSRKKLDELELTDEWNMKVSGSKKYCQYLIKKGGYGEVNARFFNRN